MCFHIAHAESSSGRAGWGGIRVSVEEFLVGVQAKFVSPGPGFGIIGCDIGIDKNIYPRNVSPDED